jgi:putative Mg2+ transporter-C (MgtC) family protein
VESAQWLAALQGQPWELLGRLVTAAVLGGAIGLEREAKDQSAGLRTNMLVSLGSCLFTILSIVGFPTLDAGGGQGAIRDSARIAAQIVSGIGFLGAGALFRDGDGVRGMTTAATIWLVAAIGMAAGAGSYFIASAATLLALVVLILLRPLSAAVAPSDRHEK